MPKAVFSPTCNARGEGAKSFALKTREGGPFLSTTLFSCHLTFFFAALVSGPMRGCYKMWLDTDQATGNPRYFGEQQGPGSTPYWIGLNTKQDLLAKLYDAMIVKSYQFEAIVSCLFIGPWNQNAFENAVLYNNGWGGYVNKLVDKAGLDRELAKFDKAFEQLLEATEQINELQAQLDSTEQDLQETKALLAECRGFESD